MIIEDKFTVRAPRQALWDFLIDIERMSACIPGAEQVRLVEPNVYDGVFKVKVGPIAAAFSGRARLVETSPPERLVAKGEAKDPRSASRASATFTAELRPVAGDATEIAYTVDVNLLGKLGTFGQPVMREIARRLTGDFVRCVESRLQAPEAQPNQPGTAGSP